MCHTIPHGNLGGSLKSKDSRVPRKAAEHRNESQYPSWSLAEVVCSESWQAHGIVNQNVIVENASMFHRPQLMPDPILEVV